MIELSVIAPIYNEEESIEALYQALSEALQAKIEHYEIILVNDGSADRSGVMLDELAANDPRVRALHFRSNCGQTAAIWAGMRAAEGTYLALIDADLQTDPNDIFTLMPYMKEYDLANGMRVSRRDTLVKKVSSRVGNGVRNWLTGDTIYDTGCPMKLMKREVAQSYYLFNGMHRFLPTLAKMNGFKVIEVGVNHRERQYGVSKYGVFNRAFVGLMDAIVVRWLKKRTIKYEFKA
ncbi:glycosyltransferase family 2 protein [Cohnella sp. GCM10027633]|uniref:glycosyltransferase family 2 protein n=1 Tax=unclassified Cohnella TaxID=2636738 RepID=UPI00363C67BA